MWLFSILHSYPENVSSHENDQVQTRKNDAGPVYTPSGPVMNPSPLVGNAELDETEEVEEAHANDTGDLPENTDGCHKHAGKGSIGETANNSDRVQGDIEISKEGGKMDDVCYNLLQWMRFIRMDQVE